MTEYKCESCDTVFTNSPAYYRHRNKCITSKYSCICGYSTDRRPRLEKHNETCEAPKALGQQQQTIEQLQQTIEQLQEDTLEAPKVIEQLQQTIERQQKEIKDLIKFIIAIRIKCASDQYACICGFSTDRQPRLEEHKETCHADLQQTVEQVQKEIRDLSR